VARRRRCGSVRGWPRWIVAALCAFLLAGCAVAQVRLRRLWVTGGAEGRSGSVVVREAMFAHRPAVHGTVYPPYEVVELHVMIVNDGALRTAWKR
jgi:hypothetical protein